MTLEMTGAHVESPLSATLAEASVGDGDWLEAVVLVEATEHDA